MTSTEKRILTRKEAETWCRENKKKMPRHGHISVTPNIGGQWQTLGNSYCVEYTLTTYKQQ